MEKIKRFIQNKIFKWSAFALSSVIFVSFLICLIVVCSRSYSFGTYVYEETMAGNTIKMEIELDDDNEGEISTIVTVGGETQYSEIEFNYKVIDGVLFCAEKTDPEFEVMGKITSFEIVSETTESGVALKIVATNHGAVALKTVSIVMVCVFGVATVVSGLYIYLTRKKSSVDNETNVNPENTQEIEEKQD